MAIMVNGERIDDETIHEEAERMRPEYEKAFAEEAPAEREAKLQQWARDNAVERVLLEQAAKAHQDEPEIQVRESAEVVRQVSNTEMEVVQKLERSVRITKDEEDVEPGVLIQRLLERVVAKVPDPSDEAVQAYYDEHKKELMAPERIHAAHIVMHVDANTPPEVAEAKLKEAEKRLQDGADFGEVADNDSDCQDPGGDLGWFPRGQMVEEFENTVWKMKPGQVSDIFATRFGFHIVRLIERKAAAPYDLEEVEGHVRETIRRQMSDEAVEKFLDSLREKATVEEA